MTSASMKASTIVRIVDIFSVTAKSIEHNLRTGEQDR
jgi:hypothetical protein